MATIGVALITLESKFFPLWVTPNLEAINFFLRLFLVVRKQKYYILTTPQVIIFYFNGILVEKVGFF